MASLKWGYSLHCFQRMTLALNCVLQLYVLLINIFSPLAVEWAELVDFSLWTHKHVKGWLCVAQNPVTQL